MFGILQDSILGPLLYTDPESSMKSGNMVAFQIDLGKFGGSIWQTEFFSFYFYFLYILSGKKS